MTEIRWTLVITRSLGPEEYASCNEVMFNQGYKNKTEENTIWDKNYLVIVKPQYNNAHYNESPLYK